MINFLLISTTSLAFIYLAYRLLLKGEKCFAFTRYFLLFGLLLSLVLPFIEVPILIGTSALPAPQIAEALVQPFDISHDTTVNMATTSADFNVSLMLTIIYCFGVVLMSLRFARSLYRIIALKKTGEVRRESNYQVVMSKRVPSPFTFFNTVFLSSKEQLKDADIMAHERAHAVQWHTLDIMFAEILMILMWFNPLAHLLRHAIALNHEFAADEAAAHSSGNTRDYLHKILNLSSCPPQLVLSSSFSYLSLKNRVKMLTNSRSAMSIVRLKIMVALVVVCSVFALFGFQPRPIADIEKEFVVILDAGHGGEDPGATGANGLLEKDIVAKIAHQVREKLEPIPNIKVTLTREDDTFLGLSDRVSLTEKADLFLSLHVESHEWEKENFAMAIYHDKNEFSQKAEHVARLAAHEIEDSGKECKVGYSDYYVLENALCPAVMLSVGFLSNEEDARYMGSVAGQEEVAGQIARIIKMAAL